MFFKLKFYLKFRFLNNTENNTEPNISLVMSSQQISSQLVSPRGLMERNYERIDLQDASALTTSAAVATLTTMTPRLMDVKEQKRREKEMRRLAKLRIEAEIKEAKLQAKLAKKQAKRGEPVPLGVLHTLNQDGLFSFYLCYCCCKRSFSISYFQLKIKKFLFNVLINLSKIMDKKEKLKIY